MTNTTDAREMARRAERLAAQGRDLPGCTYTERIEQVRRGSGKNATVDERKTVVVGIRELSCDWWTAEGSTSAAHPFVAFDADDDRSLIENPCNREAKERWFLEHHPKRSEAGVRVHAYFVFTCMALVTAFRLHQAHAEEAERRGEDTGIGRFRRQLEMKNRDKVVVFCGEHFGIFRNFEFALLLGATVRDRALMGETVRTVFDRCGRPKADTS